MSRLAPLASAFVFAVASVHAPAADPKPADPVAADLRRVEEAGQVGQPSAVLVKALAPTKLATWKKAAEAGAPDGLYLYARCLQEGFGVAKDDEQAAKL